VELGYMLYFLVVFGFGGILLFGLAAYFCWEVVTRRHRPSWSNRTRGAKVMITLSGLLFVWLLFIPLRMIWVTRVDAISGSYTSNGVWGTATLTMHPDERLSRCGDLGMSTTVNPKVKVSHRVSGVMKEGIG
jgi:hypothetical protein